MDRFVVESAVGSDGVLNLRLPLELASANRGVRVTVEDIDAGTLDRDQRQQLFLSLAGSWQGDFEVMPDDPPEERTDLS